MTLWSRAPAGAGGVSACLSVRLQRGDSGRAERRGGRDHRGAGRPFSCLHRRHKSFCYRTACQPGVNRPPAKSATIWRPRGAITAHRRAALRSANDRRRLTLGSSAGPLGSSAPAWTVWWSGARVNRAPREAEPRRQRRVRHEVMASRGGLYR